MWIQARTLTGGPLDFDENEVGADTGYYVAVVIVFSVINAVAWGVGSARRHDLAVFSAGFLLGALGMYIATALYGYQRPP